VYPEQYQYMLELKRTLDSEGHAILEMPTGTGKTVCLLSLILSFIKQKKPNFKLVYCTRTIVEMEKTLEELKFVVEQREKDFDHEGGLKSPILAMCLSSRKNLCIHEKVSLLDDREKVDSACRSLTASWVREKSVATQDLPNMMM
jgi:DNA excision repair protein ERCC-2